MKSSSFAYILALALAGVNPPCECQRAKLAWEPNPPNKEVVNYRVYYGDKKGFTKEEATLKVDVGNVTEHISDVLENGKITYFKVTAINKYGLESQLSKEVYFYGTSIRMLEVKDGRVHYQYSRIPTHIPEFESSTDLVTWGPLEIREESVTPNNDSYNTEKVIISIPIQGQSIFFRMRNKAFFGDLDQP